jgi:diguanylate cyclase (GGDEF)-like protein/PAS domain S-box-containing protein
MADRTELFEAALGRLPDGIALLGTDDHVVFWNQAAEAITGFKGMDLVGQALPEELDSLMRFGAPHQDRVEEGEQQRATLVQVRHNLGHNVPLVAHCLALRDALGKRIGTAVVFNPAESLDALPHGECSEGGEVAATMAEFQERLNLEYGNFVYGGLPFGLLWITVDQAHQLRATHGTNACEAMLEKVQRALAQGLRPGEKMGRWGDDEYLVLSHERTPEMLTAHAKELARLARTADFRWWGDKVEVTVSIGAAQADKDASLVDLLGQAKAAMLASSQAGGNQITNAPRGK